MSDRSQTHFRSVIDPDRLDRALDRFPNLAACIPGVVLSRAASGIESQVAPRLLRRLEQSDGFESPGLHFDDFIVGRFNEQDVPGWRQLRRNFATADSNTYRSHISEFRLAYGLEQSGFRLLGFGHKTSGGQDMDIRVDSGIGELLIEVISPYPGEQWPAQCTDQVVSALERVNSGLLVAVDGYRASEPRPEPGHDREIADRFVSAVRSRRSFRRGAILISRDRGDPIDITVVGSRRRYRPDTTGVSFSWQWGESPSPRNLAGKLLMKRRQLAPDRAGMIVADLSMFDLVSMGGPTSATAHALRSELQRLSGPGPSNGPQDGFRLPEAFGLCIVPSSIDEATAFWRDLLYVDPPWGKTALGRLLTAYWRPSPRRA